MGHNTKIPATREDVLTAFEEALAASEALSGTFTRIGMTSLAAVADRNTAAIRSARDEFLSIVEPLEPLGAPDAPKPCGFCEADGLPGDNDHCVWDGTPHYWHQCDSDCAAGGVR